VSAFLVDGFARGEALLIVATPHHVELITSQLEQAGIDVRDAERANRVTILDAAQTLEKFMRQDGPNPEAFDEVVGTLVARLSADTRLCIYGEMVDVLAERGRFKAAHQLEELWNVLGKRASFTLFCGYASGHFGDPRAARILKDICDAHSHVHRKQDDLLAEYLHDQQAAASGGTSTASAAPTS